MSARDETPLLSVEHLCIDYLTEQRPVRAVDDVSFSIKKGEILGLAGESGSGKSTIALGILRLLAPPAIITGGSARFLGKDILSMSEQELREFRWKQTALVFQSAMNALNPVMTIGAQIMDVILAHEAETPKRAKERASELLNLVGISDSHLKSYPHQLSGGMRQRVVIAIALSLNPPLLFMDEPTTALDVVVQKEILQQITELKNKLGFSILFITHDLSLMLEFCDTIGVLYAGKLCEISPASDLLERAQHPYTRGLLGSAPQLHGQRTRLVGIQGSPPDMKHPPTGCRFHPRCNLAAPDCSTLLPKLVPVAPQHECACLLVPESTAR